MSFYKELIAQRETLNRQIEEARRAEAASAISQVRQLIADFGLTAADCGFKVGTTAPVMTRKTVAAKYRGPQGETWSGRGKAPNWLTSLEAQGRHRNDFLVDG
ncbi:MAG TPA: H-NS histone family protein [Accumulibacter sp.]|jgi:DNA-binding protein H-NS|nr:H-NS histone family protein [Accumulibacter sp.]HQC79144.1 H-NS histone family protein [Accumulibacter sp.]